MFSLLNVSVGENHPVLSLYRHLRVFRSEIYRKVSIFSLTHFENQEFFESEMAYVLPIFEMLSSHDRDKETNLESVEVKLCSGQVQGSELNCKSKLAFGDFPLFKIKDYSNSQIHDLELNGIGILPKYEPINKIA